MSEYYWMDWSAVPDNQKNVLYRKVSLFNSKRLGLLFHIEQVYNDPRIPIIKRYKDNWATRLIAKTIAGARRKKAYGSGDAKRPEKYNYNVTNSSKRDPKAPRGRKNISITSKKGKSALPTEEQKRDAGLREQEVQKPTDSDFHPTNPLYPPPTTSLGPQDAGPSRLVSQYGA